METKKKLIIVHPTFFFLLTSYVFERIILDYVNTFGSVWL